jgi:hypothetical protein
MRANTIVDCAKEPPDYAVRVNIETTPEEIEAKTGMATGMEVATIDVRHLDDGITRFWVTLRITKNGRIKCEVATNVIGSRCNATKSKSLTGTKWPNAHDLTS